MLIFLITWFAIGIPLSILQYGIEFAYWQRKWASLADHDYSRDRRDAILGAIVTLFLPPVSPIMFFLFFERGKYGLKFK